MSTVPDWTIRALAERERLVEPFTEAQLNPASYDVQLGEKILIEVETTVDPSGWAEVDISTSTYMMEAGEFVLASIKESLTVPDHMEAVFCLKSSRGREGYQHMLSGYIDPGYEGRITLELHNSSRLRPLPLYAGMLIGQIRFASMSSPPQNSYRVTGQYNGDAVATPSKREDQRPNERVNRRDAEAKSRKRRP